MTTYFDTSALVKLLVTSEDGSREAELLWEQASRVYVSLSVYPEATAALAAARRAGRLSDADCAVALEELHEHLRSCVVLSVSDSLVRHAATLAMDHGLRAADAVHLATALAVVEPDTTFVTWDKRLWQAVIRAGLVAGPANL